MEGAHNQTKQREWWSKQDRTSSSDISECSKLFMNDVHTRIVQGWNKSELLCAVMLHRYYVAMCQ